MSTASRDVVSLEDLCLLTVSSFLSPFNIWSIYRLVPHVHCQRIKHIVHSFICDNFMDISHTDHFLALDENEINWILDNEDIKVSEAAILDSLVRWYKHSQSQRENAFKRLFVKLELSGINKDVLSVIIKKYQLDKVIPKLRKYKKLLRQRVDAVERLFHQENIVNIAVLGLRSVSTFKRDYNVTLRYWMPMASKEAAFRTIIGQFEFDFKVYNIFPVQHDIFIFGWKFGINDDNSHSGTLVNVKLDCNNGTVTKCAPLSWRMYPHYLSIQCGIFIYLLGGFEFRSSITYHSIYRYDIVNDEWKELLPMNNGCSAYSYDVVSYNSRYLYVFGVHSSERYDMCTNTWTLLLPPWEDIYSIDDFRSVSASVLDKNILVRLEKENLCRLFIYDSTTDNWQAIGESSDRFIAENYFGENFVLRGGSQSIGTSSRAILSFSILDLDSLEEKKLASVKNGGDDLNKKLEHIIVLSRGALKHL